MEKALKDAHNSVTLAEAEYRRLVELRVAEESTIVEITKRKVYEMEELEKVSSQLAYMGTLIARDEATIATQSEKLVALDRVISEKDKELAGRERDAQKRDFDLRERSETLIALEESYLVKSKKLQEDIEAHNKKVKILSEAIKLCN